MSYKICNTTADGRGKGSEEVDLCYTAAFEKNEC